MSQQFLMLTAFVVLASAVMVADSSPGCGQKSPWPAGALSQGTVQVRGGAGLRGKALVRSYLIQLPETYESDKEHPLLLYFHGWGGLVDDHRASDLGTVANNEGWIFIRPLGMDDVPDIWRNRTDFSYRSWNGSGSVASPGPVGASCAPNAEPSPCYESCGQCKDHCWWTTCADDVAFVGRLLDQIESTLCIDLELVVASGMSNGGIFLYELAAHESVSSRLTAILPYVGLPHVGFNRAPATPLILFGIWGRNDTVVPGFHLQSEWAIQAPDGATVSYDGFFYVPVENVINRWLSTVNQAGPLRRQFRTPYDGEQGLACTSSDVTASGRAYYFPAVVACTFDGGHGMNDEDLDQSPNLLSRVIVKVFLRQLRPLVLPVLFTVRELDAQLAGEHSRFFTLAGISAVFSVLGLLCAIYAYHQRCIPSVDQSASDDDSG